MANKSKSKKDRDPWNNKDQWYEEGFELSNGTKFTLVHNFPNIPGVRLGDALTNWLVRTDEFTADSFVKYVMSKNTGYCAITKEDYDLLLKEHNSKKELN